MVLFLAKAVAATSWPDCTADTGSNFGPYAVIVENNKRLAGNISFPTYRPANLTAASDWPAFVFMHGSGCDDRFMSQAFERWASHGFIVVNPFMGTEYDCKNPLEDGLCSDKSSDGLPILEGISWLKQQNNNPSSSLYQHVDTENIAVGGWSMGGVVAIKAVANLPPDSVRAVVLDSPSVIACGFLYNYSQKVIAHDYAVGRNRTRGPVGAPWFMYTCTNDFLQQPVLHLYETAGSNSTSAYAQYKTRYCRDRPPYLNETIWELVWETGDLDDTKGHFSGAGTLLMTGWTTTFLKLTLQQQSATSSTCHELFWGDGHDSIENDTRMAAVKRITA